VQRVVWCEDSVEPPLRLENLSALHIRELQINTMTLTEVLLLHQWFFWKSGGKHLDVKNVTRCDGSRYSDGGVPGVGFDRFYGRVGVDRYHSAATGGDLRSRQAVS
jgi:hypothetical protein